MTVEIHAYSKLQIKAICIKYVQEYVADFQAKRAKATDEIVAEFMSIRPLEWKGNPMVPRADLVVPVKKPDAEGGDAAAEGAEGDGKMTKNQLKKLQKQQEIEKKKAEKEKAKAEAAAAKAAGNA